MCWNELFGYAVTNWHCLVVNALIKAKLQHLTAGNQHAFDCHPYLEITNLDLAWERWGIVNWNCQVFLAEYTCFIIKRESVQGEMYTLAIEWLRRKGLQGLIFLLDESLTFKSSIWVWHLNTSCSKGCWRFELTHKLYLHLSHSCIWCFCHTLMRVTYFVKFICTSGQQDCGSRKWRFKVKLQNDLLPQ